MTESRTVANPKRIRNLKLEDLIEPKDDEREQSTEPKA